MLRLLTLCVCLGAAFSKAVVNETLSDPVVKSDRAITLGCVDPARVTYNPCTNNPLGKTSFPHPSDNSKFIQCGPYSRMFLVQCPVGELYDQASSSCVRQAFITTSPVTLNPSVTSGIPNPCTAQNLAAGRYFFGLSADQTKYIACDQSGNGRLLTCPAQMVWDANRASCVFLVQTGVILRPGTIGTGLGTPTGVVTTGNPCSAQTLATNRLFFPHPDPTKFIQCDLQGNAFVQQCPSGLVWNQYEETCSSQSGVQQTGIIQPGGSILTAGTRLPAGGIVG